MTTTHDSFRGLKVWQKAMDLVEEIYRTTTVFPKDERFGLSAQLRRAAVSIASNIGEGKRRKRQRAFLYHLDVALGSQGEVDVQVEIARRVEFIDTRTHQRLQVQIDEVGRMLNGLITSMQVEE